MAGNRIELWGTILGEPEFRVTPAGTAILRFTVACGDEGGELALMVIVTGESAEQTRHAVKAGSAVRVAGSVRATKRRLKSGMFDTAYEVMAASVAAEN